MIISIENSGKITEEEKFPFAVFFYKKKGVIPLSARFAVIPFSPTLSSSTIFLPYFIYFYSVFSISRQLSLKMFR